MTKVTDDTAYPKYYVATPEVKAKNPFWWCTNYVVGGPNGPINCIGWTMHQQQFCEHSIVFFSEADLICAGYRHQANPALPEWVNNDQNH